MTKKRSIHNLTYSLKKQFAQITQKRKLTSYVVLPFELPLFVNWHFGTLDTTFDIEITYNISKKKTEHEKDYVYNSKNVV